MGEYNFFFDWICFLVNNMNFIIKVEFMFDYICMYFM